MSTTIRTRFANGVLEPLEGLRLHEGEEVVLRVDAVASAPGRAWLDETAGGWKGLVDADDFKQRIEESRLLVTRPEPRL